MILIFLIGLAVLFWFGCGFLAYGLMKSYQFYSVRTNEHREYGFADEWLSRLYFLLGATGLIFAVLIHLFFSLEHTGGFRLRILRQARRRRKILYWDKLGTGRGSDPNDNEDD